MTYPIQYTQPRTTGSLRIRASYSAFKAGLWLIQRVLCGSAMSRLSFPASVIIREKERSFLGTETLCLSVVCRQLYCFFLTTSISKPVFISPLSPALSNHSASLWAGIRELQSQVSQPLKLHKLQWLGRAKTQETEGKTGNHHALSQPR